MSATPTRNQAFYDANDHPVRIKIASGRGRYAVAKRDLKEGDLILTARSRGMALFHACRKQACSSCCSFTTSADPSRLPFSCRHCHFVRYCSRRCLVDRHPLHLALECALLREVASRVPQGDAAFGRWRGNGGGMQVYERGDIVDLARWCVAVGVRGHVEEAVRDLEGLEAFGFVGRGEERELVAADMDGDEGQQVERLYTLMTKLSGKRKEMAVAIENQQEGLEEPHGASVGNVPAIEGGFSGLFVRTFPTLADFSFHIGVRQANCFGVWDSAGERLGQIVYPSASFFNHDCVPTLALEMGCRDLDFDEPASAAGDEVDAAEENTAKDLLAKDVGGTVTLFEAVWAYLREPTVEFRTVRDMAEGEELSHCYVDRDLGYDERRRALKDGYGFECQCARCMMEKAARGLTAPEGTTDSARQAE
ncbi:hypothetical protein HK101_005395 [Irineochytrium annulatum]|nr:hypothetical protein HK101_005395 [Irineochytrium annulatum]